ncbi:VOC family protein [Pseudomonas sp. PB106]|uniref:VOC family protein n=1 Tax=Pseudomonas sp. PB106 TaxID=2494699 RepID=UPI00131D39CD|nr:VOC family protein [Pseudomonas sp. PB106]KAE9647205.1 VOC family protein [Pseudomonas sp. PB106]
MSTVKYSHTNLIASDWKKLAKFYSEVFGCEQVGPVRSLSGLGVSGGTGVQNARLEGVHLRFPGFGPEGPTLEIFQYQETLERETAYANSKGLTHIAFEVTNMDEICAKVIRQGGWMLGKLVRQEVEGVGVCTFVYVRDPDRNIIEIQMWDHH